MERFSTKHGFIAGIGTALMLVAESAFVLQLRIKAGASLPELFVIAFLLIGGGMMLGQYTITRNLQHNPESQSRLTAVFFGGALLVAEVPLLIVEYGAPFTFETPFPLFSVLFALVSVLSALVVMLVLWEHDSYQPVSTLEATEAGASLSESDHS